MLEGQAVKLTFFALQRGWGGGGGRGLEVFQISSDGDDQRM